MNDQPNDYEPIEPPATNILASIANNAIGAREALDLAMDCLQKTISILNDLAPTPDQAKALAAAAAGNVKVAQTIELVSNIIGD